ncbi:hypothetical protein KY41_08380 [Latilactobacillus sakei]|nr:hypothetical protein KY41_08380 [Latilactobacillus sakei]
MKMEQMYRPELVGKTWTIQDLRKELGGIDYAFVKDHVLDPNRVELDVMNGGFIQWSSGKGSPWRIQANPMAVWIENNWSKIMTGGW